MIPGRWLPQARPRATVPRMRLNVRPAVAWGAVFLLAGGASILGCSSRAEEQHASMPKAEARIVFYAMPG